MVGDPAHVPINWEWAPENPSENNVEFHKIPVLGAFRHYKSVWVKLTEARCIRLDDRKIHNFHVSDYVEPLDIKIIVSPI